MQVRNFQWAIVLIVVSATWVAAQQPAPTAFDPAKSDAKAIQVADEMMQAMGGVDAWRKTRFLRYDWVVEQDGKAVRNYQHLWDKHTGRYRLEGVNDGKLVTVLFNVNTKAGTAYLDGEPAPAAETQRWLDFGYQRFINDGYWFYMPFKWKDPGVTLKYEGEEKMNGKTYDVVRLTYDNVGLTPKDIFWGYVNRETHMMDQWRYILKGEKKPQSVVNWSGWESHGGVMMSADRNFPEDPNRRILIRNISTPAQAEDRYFTSPEASLSGFSPGN